MLYGISLAAGLLGTAHLPTLAAQLAERLPGMPADELTVLGLAGLMIMVGLAFKLSAVPFHFWCPDVFEGATAEVGAFLSVASKAAALALLVRVAIGFGSLPYASPAGELDALASRQAVANESNLVWVAQLQNSAAGDPRAAERPTAQDNRLAMRDIRQQQLAPSRAFIGRLIALLAVITCTFGNLAAYTQTNVKRLLAYSTIAHAGYMMMPVSALMVMADHLDHTAAAGGSIPATAVSALAVYIGVYVFMNLGAFAIVAFLRNATGSEEIADYAGLIRRAPLLVICFSLILFGLVGLPPLSGFIGKFAIFAALVDGYQVSVAAGQAEPYLLAVLVAGGLNTVISLFYYLRVVKVMTMDDEPAGQAPLALPILSLQTAYVCLLTLPTAALILSWDLLNEWALAAGRYLLA
jgi:NADH-quinone oxidoreductase subunit N